ncbi:MAG: nitroreductase [Desulfobulbaceae bacterium]|nr:MAG: nitroreductase [Desulfobulbaceae bacterium]
MQNFSEVVTGRRSIRRFTDQQVDDQTLNEILEQARWTPSWANTQCWEIIVVRNDDLKNGLSEILSPKNPAKIAIANGPLTLVFCAEKQKAGYYKNSASTELGDWLMYDLGLITQTICLAAHDKGLGTVIVGAFDHKRASELLEVPAEFQLVSMVPMGYPDHAPSAPKRREINEFTHRDTFA